MKKLIIYSPVYQRNCAGIYCLYKLAKDIKDLGHIALTTLWNSNNVMPSVFDVPIIPNIVAKQLIDAYDFSVLYPEVTPGNPLQAKNVIRWLMNKPQTFGVGDSVFDSSEKIFTYNEKFSLDLENEIKGTLTLPTIDVDLFRYDPNIEKTDITVYTGKSMFKDGYINRYDNLITRTSPDHQTVAMILKKTKTLYSFDCTTNIINEARIAGCNVVLIDDGTLVNNEANSEFGNYGISIFNSQQQQSKIGPRELSQYMLEKLHENDLMYKKQLNYMLEFIK